MAGEGWLLILFWVGNIYQAVAQKPFLLLLMLVLSFAHYFAEPEQDLGVCVQHVYSGLWQPSSPRLRFISQASSESNMLPCKWALCSHSCFSMTGTQCVSSPVCYSADWNVPLASFHTNFHSKCNDGFYSAFSTSWHKLRIPVILRSHDCIIIPLSTLPYSFSALVETCILTSPTLAFSFCLLHSPSSCHLKQTERNIL